MGILILVYDLFITLVYDLIYKDTMIILGQILSNQVLEVRAH